jgi:hypothetical protein
VHALARLGLGARSVVWLVNGLLLSVALGRSVKTGVVGLIGRGAVYALIGLFLERGAVLFDPNEAKGLDATLQTVAAQPYGKVLLGLAVLASWRTEPGRLSRPSTSGSDAPGPPDATSSRLGRGRESTLSTPVHH